MLSAGAHLAGSGGSPPPGTGLQGCGTAGCGPDPSHSSGLMRHRTHIRGSGFGERRGPGLFGEGQKGETPWESSGDQASLRTPLSINSSLAHPLANQQVLFLSSPRSFLASASTHTLLFSVTHDFPTARANNGLFSVCILLDSQST